MQFWFGMGKMSHRNAINIEVVAKIGIAIGAIVQTKSNFYKLKKAYALMTYISTTIQIKTKIPFFVKLKKN